ncbi:MAG: lipid-A-disaccharide synthase [Deltaproteobacteria bacterium]|nr:MAG: lipid-A-disaccharide synthase [Deltaproteobacteria bacterium]
MEPVRDQKCVMIIAGEVSGDSHGAKLVDAMRERNESLFFCGIGGNALKKAGVRILVEASELSVVGITEVFSKGKRILKGIGITKRLLKTLRPDLLILIDYPGFNLHIAATAKKLGVPVLYYISPQIWAWRPGRVNKIGKRVDHMAVILPFEEEFYRKHHIPVSYVGHPLLDNNSSQRDMPVAREINNHPVIGILPGSRDREIASLLPIMLAAARRLLKRDENIRFIISIAPSVDKKYFKDMVQAHGLKSNYELVSDRVERIFERCDLAVVASGTVTLEAAICGTPIIIVYKISPLSSLIGKMLVKVNHIGLVNLIAGKEIAPELVQDKATAENITNSVLQLLENDSTLEKQRREMLRVKELLGGSGASIRVAEIATNMLKH